MLIRTRHRVDQSGYDPIPDLRSVLEQFRQLGDPIGCHHTLNDLGERARLTGDYGHAARYYHESLAPGRAHGNRWIISLLLNNLGWLAYNQGDPVRAQVYLAEGLLMASNDGYEATIAWCLVGLGFLALGRGQTEQAVRLFGATKVSWDAALPLTGAEDIAEYERRVAEARVQLGELAFTAAWAAGQALTLTQAAEEARAWMEKSA